MRLKWWGVTGDMELFKTEEYREYSDAVQVVVDFYGPSDISQVNNKPRDPFVVADKSRIPEDILFGGCVAEHPELAEPGNPPATSRRELRYRLSWWFTAMKTLSFHLIKVSSLSKNCKRPDMRFILQGDRKLVTVHFCGQIKFLM